MGRHPGRPPSSRPGPAAAAGPSRPRRSPRSPGRAPRRRRTAACRRADGGQSWCRRWATARPNHSARGPRGLCRATPSVALLDGILSGPPVAYLERLELADPCVLVAARVRRPGETDLGPGGWMGVEGRACIPGPQAPYLRGPQPVPAGGLQVLHSLDQRQLVGLGSAGERGTAALAGVRVQVRQRVPPGLAVLRHVVVPPAVGLTC